MSTHELIQLGIELDSRGVAGNELALRRLVRTARSLGVAGVAADVLADTTAPYVARMRAFAVVSAAVAGHTPWRSARTVA